MPQFNNNQAQFPYGYTPVNGVFNSLPQFSLPNSNINASNNPYSNITSNGVAEQQNGSKYNPIGSQVGNGLAGILEVAMALNNQNKLGQRPKLEIGDEYKTAYQKAKDRANQGLTAGQVQNAYQDMGNYQRTAQQGITSASGGNLSQAVAGQLNANKLNAVNDLTNTDSQLKQQNNQLYQAKTGELQGLQNSIQANEQANYDAKRLANAQSLTAGVNNLGQLANYAGFFL